MEKKIPVVAHYSNAFFMKSETFIYHYLTHMKYTRPVCLAWNFENLDIFSFPREDIYLLQFPWYSLNRVYYGVLKRVLKRNLYFEQIIKKRDVRVIHAHFGHNGVDALRLKRELNLHIPLITTFYGADSSSRVIVDALRERYLELFAEGEMFLVEGPFLKSALMKLGCAEEKILIQRIAVPVDEISFRERKPGTGGQPVRFLFCGRFIEKKGLIYVLEAVKRVWNESRRRDIRLCIIGDGELKGEIESFIEKNNMWEYVELPGFLSYVEYIKKLEQADIFIHPSVTAGYGDSEGGAPTVILEAQAAGLPVVSTFHADIPNVVVPGKSALLSPERDVDGLVQNILFLMDNRDVWSEMGKAGRDFVTQYHDIVKEVCNLEEKYMNLIENRCK
jgi:colanic acid/amylovoran biosynthesis glycosyltransferase